MTEKTLNIDDIVNQNFVADLIKSTCGSNYELIVRPASYLLRNLVEDERDIYRLIILPPKGYTADKIDQMNSHDEAEYATIDIKGAVRRDKNSYSVLKNCLLIASINKNAAANDLNKPYMIYDIGQGESEYLSLQTQSAGVSPFPVLKPDGFGFYHNLVNLSDDWLVMRLYKRLRPLRAVHLAPLLQNLLSGEAIALQKFYDAVVKHGDNVFSIIPNLIDNICRMPVTHSLPALGEMLHIHDSGRHEACSIFAVILRIGKNHPEAVIEFLQTLREKKAIPQYYASQLIEKINLYRLAGEAQVLREAV